MASRGISLALNTVGIAILVLVVVLVLGFLFLGYVLKFIGIEDDCGEGTLDAYQCYEERQEDSGHCFKTGSNSCATGTANSQEDGQTYCCRVPT